MYICLLLLLLLLLYAKRINALWHITFFPKEKMMMAQLQCVTFRCSPACECAFWMEPMWPDLAQFYKSLAKFYLLAKCWSSWGKNVLPVGKFSLLQMAKYFKIIFAIWSHCLYVTNLLSFDGPLITRLLCNFSILNNFKKTDVDKRRHKS